VGGKRRLGRERKVRERRENRERERERRAEIRSLFLGEKKVGGGMGRGGVGWRRGNGGNWEGFLSKRVGVYRIERGNHVDGASIFPYMPYFPTRSMG